MILVGKRTFVVYVVVIEMMFLAVVAPTTIKASSVVSTSKVITTLRGGDLEKSLKMDWWPMIKSLASGNVPGDKYSWTFENSPLYSEGESSFRAESALKMQALYDLEYPDLLFCEKVKEAPIGIFNIDRMGYEIETRPIIENGETYYRCAVVELYVKKWQDANGAECSRSKAVDCYKKCQKKINNVVKKMIAARSKNGKKLTKAQKFKFIHDWLIASVDYDYSGFASTWLSAESSFDTHYGLYNEYGAIVDGKTICRGYSFAFKAIVDEYNKQTGEKLVCDVAYSDNHAWNRVYLNGCWYVVDVTWDESISDYVDGIETAYFLVSDKEHDLTHYQTCSGDKMRAKSRKYENRKWATFKKSLKECTVSLKHPNKVYYYKGEQVIPEVVVKYGKNVIPKTAYRVVRTDRKKTGIASFKIVPSKKCKVLKGSLKGLSFRIKKMKTTKSKHR